MFTVLCTWDVDQSMEYTFETLAEAQAFFDECDEPDEWGSIDLYQGYECIASR